MRFVENGVQLPLGGPWKTATARSTYSHYFADTAAGRPASSAAARAGQGMIPVLPRGAAGKIAEIEQLAIRTRSRRYEKLRWTRCGSRLCRRAASVARAIGVLADRYYTGMQGNDPKGDYPSHKDCNRVEHGRQTTNAPASNYGHPTSRIS